jgi:exodeoxyribonuclease VII small subunit
MSEKEQQNFEEALSRLEEIVSELEDESISLEKSIQLYEEGIKLSKLCTQTLEEAELRIEKVAAEQNAEEKNNN